MSSNEQQEVVSSKMETTTAAAQEAVARSSIEDVIERARDAIFGAEATPASAVIDWIEAELTNAAPVAAAQEAVTWLSKDDAQLALFQAIQAIRLGNPTDDKMILANLREAGLWIGRYAAATGAAATGIDLEQFREAVECLYSKRLSDYEDGQHSDYDMASFENERQHLLHLIDASPKGCDAQDGARWRYVRRKLCLTGNGDGTCQMRAINLPAAIPGWPEPAGVEGFCDAAIDAAMQATSAEVGA